uniref:Uncharacterized protein n=1 Tax=Guillardia theta TaxID=55529 RepID=A0A7S4UKL5_GUITH|mmetsp:Transcript_7141/g.24787  ORF Transcript_7141/g.24787 Transcript_7141/m.24787 type:complete len:513 (+) Transcript_7141:214-1752(+)
MKRRVRNHESEALPSPLSLAGRAWRGGEGQELYSALLRFVSMILVLIAVYTTMLGSLSQQSRMALQRFRSMGIMPKLGLTAGNYHYMDGSICTNCALRLRNLCGYETKNATRPPLELLFPGELSSRRNLNQRTLCFLWYANVMWSRATGGKLGLMISRLGAGIDNKVTFLERMQQYEEKYNCRPFQSYPVTLDLNDSRNCQRFLYRNDLFARNDSDLWFLKASNGSTGRHIHLRTRYQIDQLARENKNLCPRPGTVASLSVSRLWTIDNKKFDCRVYILIASFQPTLVLFHSGHLRFSAINFTASVKDDLKMEAGDWLSGVKIDPEKDRLLARHITNPRFGTSHTNDTSRVIRPFDTLRKELFQQWGPEEGKKLWARLNRNIRRAVLSVFFAMKGLFLQSQYYNRWAFAIIAYDIAIDQDLNPFVLDINSGPSFYHGHKWPTWFVKERSLLIRSAMDIVQHVAFLKLAGNESLRRLQVDKPWEMIYEDAPQHFTSRNSLEDGECLATSNETK